jgi:type IV secretion system protein VirD4
MLEVRRARPFSPFLGWDGDSFDLYLADADSPVLALGPAGTGKTSSIMSPNVLMSPGPCVSTSSRVDTYMTTAASRARMGRVWHFSATDADPPGAYPLRFSPLQGCEDWTTAREVAERWAHFDDLSSASRHKDHGGHPHFRALKAQLLASMFYYAAVTDRDMEFVANVITSMRFEKELLPIVKELERIGPGAAAGSLDGILRAYSGERSGAFTTAALAVKPYLTEAAIRSQREPNFDPDAFVRGVPDEIRPIWFFGRPGLAAQGIYPRLEGSHDTLYITTGDGESNTMPIYLDLLWRIRDAARRYFREAEVAGKDRPKPVLFALDELAAVPIPDLDRMLADQRDKGTVLVCGIQSLSQAADIYGKIGEDFINMFRTAVAFRGIKDATTLDLLSKLSGHFWQEKRGYSQAANQAKGVDWSHNVSYDRQERLTPAQIATGHPYWPDAALCVLPNAQWQWIDCKPVYRGEPWPRILISSCEYAYSKRLQVPPPPLAKNANYLHLEALGLAERYEALEAEWVRVAHIIYA